MPHVSTLLLPKMPSRPVWLAKSRISKSQRAHFAIWILNAADASKDPNTRSVPCRGTVIHVVGSPMAGYQHQFKRNHACGSAQDLESLVQIGSVDSAYVTDPPTYVYSEDDTAIGQLDAMALRIPAPRRSENFMAPVNDVSSSTRGGSTNKKSDHQ